MRVEHLEFWQVREAYPDRWEKARPGNQLVNPHDTHPGRYICRRQGSDEWHEVTLVSIAGESFGACDCEGFEYNDGPCSHLCAVYRLIDEDVEMYQPRVRAADVELESVQDQRAQIAAEPEERAAADGGVRR